MSTPEQTTSSGSPVGHDPTDPTSRPLGLPGRIAAVAVAVLAVAVGLTSGVGFLESAPYCIVGGVLAIRRRVDRLWGVGCRPTNSPVEAGCVAVNRDLAVAFRLLADKIRARHLPPGLSN